MSVLQASNTASIIVLTGPSGSGKTTLCRRLVDAARQQGLSVRGIMSPGRWRGGTKVRIDVLDVSTGETKALAEASGEADGPALGEWRFHAGALAWGMAVLRRSVPSDVLVVDELGPLELWRGAGWAGAIDILRAGDYRHALVVVRPGLVERLLELLAGMDTAVVDVTQADEASLLAGWALP